MYSIEIVVSFLLVTHGLLCIALIDNLKSIRLITSSNRYSKYCLVIYVLIFLVRTCIYLKVHHLLILIDNTNDIYQGFGNFLASYISNIKGVAITVTLIYLSVILMSFVLNLWLIYLLNRLMNFCENGQYSP